MSTTREKLDVIEWLVLQDDPEVLKRVLTLVQQIESEKFSNSKVIGQKPNGTKVSRTELINTFDLAMKQFKTGEFITLDELDERSENW